MLNLLFFSAPFCVWKILWLVCWKAWRKFKNFFSPFNQRFSQMLRQSVYRIFISIWGNVRLIICLLENFYCIPSYALINLILSPLYLMSIEYFSYFENVLYCWLLYVVSSWSYCCGLVVHEHGDDINKLSKGLLLAFCILI